MYKIQIFLGAIQVLRNAVRGRGVLAFLEKKRSEGVDGDQISRKKALHK